MTIERETLYNRDMSIWGYKWHIVVIALILFLCLIDASIVIAQEIKRLIRR